LVRDLAYYTYLVGGLAEGILSWFRCTSEVHASAQSDCLRWPLKILPSGMMWLVGSKDVSYIRCKPQTAPCGLHSARTQGCETSRLVIMSRGGFWRHLLGRGPHAQHQWCPWGAQRELGVLRVHGNCYKQIMEKRRVREGNCGYAKGFQRAPGRHVGEKAQIRYAREHHLAGSGGVWAHPASYWTTQVCSTHDACMGVNDNEH
jgi:hypothetical protein